MGGEGFPCCPLKGFRGKVGEHGEEGIRANTRRQRTKKTDFRRSVVAGVGRISTNASAAVSPDGDGV